MFTQKVTLPSKAVPVPTFQRIAYRLQFHSHLQIRTSLWSEVGSNLRCNKIKFLLEIILELSPFSCHIMLSQSIAHHFLSWYPSSGCFKKKRVSTRMMLETTTGSVEQVNITSTLPFLFLENCFHHIMYLPSYVNVPHGQKQYVYITKSATETYGPNWTHLPS